mmetsp:Transcript_3434/g.4607  ORF Transcript_3434/g.4607 Transcript_3434/m.4607 type:complete len:273 (-) Transcript_3434:73-891(-)
MSASSFVTKNKYWMLAGLASGISVGVLFSVARSFFSGEEEEKRIKRCKYLGKLDFFRFQRTILHNLASCPSIKFSVDELRAIYAKYYTLIEDDHKGCIKHKTLRSVYEEVYSECNFFFKAEGKDRTKYVIDKMIRAFDSNDDQIIDFPEFVIALNAMAHDDPEKRMERLFKLMDADKNGTLSPEELTDMIDLTLPSFTKEQKQDMLKRIISLDVGMTRSIGKMSVKGQGDGQIDMKEWMSSLNKFGFEAFHGPNEFEVSLLKYFGAKIESRM